MRAKFLPLLLGVAIGWIVSSATPSRSAPPDDRAADRAAIREHIDTIFRAYADRDAATVRATHAAGWRGFLRESRSIIRGIDDYMAAASPYVEGEWPRIRGYEMDELEIVFRGETAIVPYVATMEVEGPDGSLTPVTLRVLDVYGRDGGHWNQIASNTCDHPDTVEAHRRQPRHLGEAERRRLLEAREAVWWAWFGNDRPALEAVLPTEFVGINWGGGDWVDRRVALASAADFAAAGGRLAALRFPRTEIQVYGDVTILYSEYEAEVESGTTVTAQSGRATEVFVWHGDRWVHTGWHLDSGS